MIPVFFKAIRPAAGAVQKPKEKPAAPADDQESDIIPHDEPEGDEAAPAPADAEKPAPDAEKAPDDAENADPDAPPAAEPAEGDAADDDTTGSAKGEKPGAAPDMENYAELLAIISERMENAGDFGPHNVKPGHHIAFSAGDFAGSGKVAAAGRDGARVHDSSGREHQVHWGEVTGHFAGDEEGEEPASKAKPAGKGKAKGDAK